LFYRSTHHPTLPSFPTRRSSDLVGAGTGAEERRAGRSVRGSRTGTRAGTRAGTRVCAEERRICTGTRARAEERRTRTRTHAEERSEEHTSELQSLTNLVCRLLLE